MGNLIVGQGFYLGSLQIRYYGLTMVLAVALGYVLAYFKAKKENFDLKLFDDYVFWLVIISFLTARLYYVVFYFQYYRNDISEVWKIWHGGLSIYGALIGGLLTTIFFARKYKLQFFEFTDIVVFGLPLAQALGRFGNFFNYEAFGGPTNLAWKMFVPLQFRPPGYEQYSYFHPTFLYEALWNVFVFAILFFVAKRYKKVGWLSATYLLFYSIGRFFIEALRLDSAYVYGVKLDQVTAVFMIILAIFIFIYAPKPQSK